MVAERWLTLLAWWRSARVVQSLGSLVASYCVVNSWALGSSATERVVDSRKRL